MELVNIHGHTIDKSLLSGGLIIDVGCRGLEFTKYFIDHHHVFAIDPDPDVFNKVNQAFVPFVCINKAVSNKTGDSFYYRNGESTCLVEIHRPLDHLISPCKTISIDDLYETTGEDVDVLKLDCEGSEYLILGEGFRPVPKQITVEFHHHLAPKLHNERINGVMINLLEYYDHVYESPGDNLFVRKWL